MNKLCFIFLLSGFGALGQYQSDLGRFTVPYPRGCAPVTVQVTQQDGFGTIARTYFYEDGLPNTTDTFHTYTEPGIYQIVQFVSLDVEPKTDTLVFEVLPSDPPDFEVFKCDGNEVQVAILAGLYDYYLVHFVPNDSVIYKPGDPLPQHTFSSRFASMRVTGFYDNAYPTCGESFRNFTLERTEVFQLEEATIEEACLSEFYLNLDVLGDALSRYEVSFQNGSGPFESAYSGSLKGLEAPISISFDPAATGYCVQVHAINACTNVRTNTVESCPDWTPASIRPLPGAYASYQGDAIQIVLSPESPSGITLERKPENVESFTEIGQISGSYLDEVSAHFRAFDYRLTQLDTCSNQIDSTLLRAPFIRITDKWPSENLLALAVTPPINQLQIQDSGWLVYNADSTATELIPQESPFKLPGGVGSMVQIRAYFDYGDFFIYSNKVMTDYETVVFVPKAFSPNGDGLNDQLELFGLPTPDFELNIYNRWGELIHRVINENPVWNGRLGDSRAVEGSYRYQIVFRLASGEVKTQVGTFVLVR